MDFSKENLLNMGVFFLLTLVLQSLFMLVIYLAFRKQFVISKYRILAIGSTLGNVGFFGLPIIQALFPNHPEVACYSAVYLISMNTLAFTAGVYCLTNNTKYLNWRSAFLNPSFFGLLAALPLYFSGAQKWMPAFLTNGISLLGKMTTPLCMLILGIRLATIPWKKLFTRPFLYLICFAKLLAFPLFSYLILILVPLPYTLKISILILSGTPCASVITGLSEIHRSETELAANCVLLSTLLCLFTIPLLVLLVS